MSSFKRHDCFLARRIQRKLLLQAVLFVLLSAQSGAIQAQSGWYHCDIQDHSYTGPGTRYFCRPVSYDWLCNIARITSFCKSSSSRGGESARDDSDNGGGGVSSASISARYAGSLMNIQRIGAASIGLQWVIDAGYIDAVDVWGEEVRGEVCLDGLGSLLFIDTGTSPRAQSWLDATRRDGRTCASLDRPGMLILMPAAARAQQCGIITTGHLKLRTGPTIDDVVIGFVPRGTRLLPIMRNEYWVNVEYEDETGWISAAYVSDDCSDTVGRASTAARHGEDHICTTGHLKLRTGPSVKDEVIDYVPRGTFLLPILRNKYWVKIEYQGESGWIGAAYVNDECRRADAVELAAREEADRICTTGKLRVRAGPALDAETIGFVRSGVKLRVVSRVGSWLGFVFRGETAWIGAAYVNEDGDCG